MSIFSPLTIGLYAIVLAFPCAMALAVANWRRLGMHRRARAHIIGVAVAAVVCAVLAFAVSAQLFRWVAVGGNIAAFAYLRERMRSDLQAYRDAYPDAEITTRAWWKGIGTALLGLAFFAAIFVGTALLLDW